MLKKVIGSVLLAGLIGVLIFGAINRTLDKTGQVAEAQGRSSETAQGRGAGGQGNGRGDATGRGYPNYETAPETWEAYEGIVVQTPEDGAELVIETQQGQNLTVGTGPSYMADQGFNLQLGESIQVRGYWEGNEFKAAQITRLTGNQTLALRDDYGRPSWAGQGRDGDDGQAQVDEWRQIQGSVVSVDLDALIVQTSDGAQIAVDGRPWWFAQEQGFWTQVDNEVTLIGFYEGEDFEIGRIDDATSGQTVLIRDENGRPLWAGGGRRGA